MLTRNRHAEATNPEGKGFVAFYVLITQMPHDRCMVNSISPHQKFSRVPGDRSVKGLSGTESAPSRQGDTFASSRAFDPLSSVSKPNFLSSLLTKTLQGKAWAELQEVKAFHKAADQLKTPTDFQVQTAKFKNRLAAGESFESMRAEVYAVASRATQVATGMKPYDCQVLGALTLGSNRIAEMMTGEGKTLTAVMPLYLHALAGKGAHLVTVNDTLAQRDKEDMGPVFELLGLTVGSVLESMTPEEKRQGYLADVTYTTDRSLGFDYLRDRTAKSLEERVQREPFFALVDEVDEVLLDEARTPLIISGPGEQASPMYHTFDGIVDRLKPGIDYFADREKGTAWLSELGIEFVENELYGVSVSRKDPDALAAYHKKAGAIRAEGKAYRAELEHSREKPGFFTRLFDREWDRKREGLQAARAEAAERTDSFPDPYNLFAPEHEHEVRYLQATLKAHALFEEGVDYIVQDQRVKIVDENKGRTSRGRRYNEGLHQALEAKSKVPLRPESRPIASITYPNLFKLYPHLSGMSGTAKTSEGEFQKLYNLGVTKIPTNLQFKTNPEDPEKAPRHNRIDQSDTIFATKKEKFEAVINEALKAYEEGIPVLVGTLSVEANQYLHAEFLKRGVNPASLQVLNAEHVRGDKALENQLISQAGQSGRITIGTNMVGRGANIPIESINYKKMLMGIEKSLGPNGLVVDVKSEKEAARLSEWLQGRYPHTIGSQTPAANEVVIRIASHASTPKGRLNSEDFAGEGVYAIGTERAKSRRIDDQFIGRSARQGKPGRSKFFLSLEDDLFLELAKNELDSSLKFVGSQVDSKFVDGLVRDAQIRLAEMDLHAREQAGLYDETLNTQRENFYQLREAVLDPMTDLRHKLTEDSKDVVTKLLSESLSSEKHHDPADVRLALDQVNKVLKTSLDWNGKGATRRADVLKAVSEQVSDKLAEAYEEFDASDLSLDQLYRQSLLEVFDAEWSNHLESMTGLRQAVQWVGVLGEKPEDAYKKRGLEVFESTLQQIAVQSVAENLGQILVGASILKRDRELAAA